MKEYGGYLSLELPFFKEYYESSDKYNVVSLNSGRSALMYIVKIKKIKEIWCPYYICESVIDALKKENVKINFYYLSKNLIPKNLNKIKKEEFILWVNYFGMTSTENIKERFKGYKNLIIDNTQAFFSKPLEEVYNIYSCRKFFGVSDGGYLIGKNIEKIFLKQDESYNRANFLLKALEVGTNKAYEDSLENEASFEKYELLGMSKLTKRILNSLDYEKIKIKRRNNFLKLHENLKKYNKISISNLDSEIFPMVYPFLYKDKNIRRHLIKEKVYIPNWWKYILKTVKKNSLEYEYSTYLFPLPIDQRYGEKEMEDIAKIITNYIEEKNVENVR